MIILSLTTVPERLNNLSDEGIKSVILSLCKQNFIDYEIHFNIPHVYNITKELYNIPEWLTDLQKEYSLLKIFRMDDIGPPTKFVPTLERIQDEDILIVVDDDLIYHPDMISEHIKYQELYKDSVICYEGRGFAERVYNDNRDSFALCVTQVRETHGVLHYKSVSYKKKLFNNNFYELYLGKTMSDDVLVSKYFLDTKVKMYVVPYLPDIEKFSTLELWEKNVGVETFPVLRHSNAPWQTGCNHPDMLKVQPRFFEPSTLGIVENTSTPIVNTVLPTPLPENYTDMIVENTNIIQLLKTYDVDSKKIRIGNAHDGGYVINELILSNVKKLISVGMGMEETFEMEMVAKHPHVQIEAYDGTYPCNDLCYKNQDYVNKSIFYTHHNVGYEKENIPLNVIVDGKQDVLLKVDVEGAEYRIFENVVLNNVVGLLIEVHDLQEKHNRDALSKLFKTSFKDLVLFHVHANSWGITFDLNLSSRTDKGIYVKDFPNTLELSFIHKKFVKEMKLETKPFPDLTVDCSNRADVADIDLYWVNSL